MIRRMLYCAAIVAVASLGGSPATAGEHSVAVERPRPAAAADPARDCIGDAPSVRLSSCQEFVLADPPPPPPAKPRRSFLAIFWEKVVDNAGVVVGGALGGAAGTLVGGPWGGVAGAVGGAATAQAAWEYLWQKPAATAPPRGK